MPRTAIAIKNISISNKIYRDLNDCSIPPGSTIEVSDTNTYDAILSSKDLWDDINADNAIVVIDGVEKTKQESLIYMKGNVLNLVLTPTLEAITGSNSGGWVPRTLACGPNKAVQIRIGKIVLNGDAYLVGVKATTSLENPISIGNAAFCKAVMTDSNSEILIYSNNLNVEFLQTDIISIQ